MAKERREPLKNGITRITFPDGTVKYEARVSFTNAAGKRRYRRKRAATLRAAQQLRARMLTAAADGKDDGPSRLTLDEWAERWFTRRERDWSEATLYTRRHQYALHVKPRFGNRKLGKITRAHCQEFADDLADQYKPSMVRNVMATLSGMLRGAAKDGLIPTSPATDLDLPTVKREDHAVWSEDEIRTFLDHTRHHRHWRIYVVMITTGMRIGEVIALTWKHVDLEAGVISINATLSRTKSGAMAPRKGAKSEAGRRVLPLSPAVVEVLRELDQSTPYVFMGQGGRHVDYSEVSRQLIAVQEGLGPDWKTLTSHGMRHTWTTMLMRSGISPAIAKVLLGHAHVSLTIDTYTHPSADDLIPAMRVAASVVDGTIRAATEP